MKMIDVINMIAEGKIEKGMRLEVDGEIYTYVDTYTDDGGCSFVDEEDCVDILLEEAQMITRHFLNSEARLIKPKEKMYYLRLKEADKFSYINLNKYNSYEVTDKDECCSYKTKFTQEQIDSDKFLKFVEQYGVKEEVKDDEND